MTSLEQERQYLAGLLEAVQRSAWFLHQSAGRVPWPVSEQWLREHRKDVDLFETLSAVNERFAKLQDTLASAMRHTGLLLSEPADSFLKILAFFEKRGVLTSVDTWQECRIVRNMAAHDYETDYAFIAEHFNTLHSMIPMLLETAHNLLSLADDELGVKPRSNDFAHEFNSLL